MRADVSPSKRGSKIEFRGITRRYSCLKRKRNIPSVLQLRYRAFEMIARLRNHNATDDGNVDFRSFRKDLYSKHGKINIK